MKDALLIPVVESIVRKETATTTAIIAKDSEHAEDLLDCIRFYLPEFNAEILSSYELLPYDDQPPSLESVSNLNISLYHAMTKAGIYIIPLQMVMEKYLTPSLFKASRAEIKKGQTLSLQEIILNAEAMGYTRSSTVREHGNYVLKGKILDIFPVGNKYPVRIHFQNNEITKIFEYNPASQRNIESIESFAYYPATPVPFTEKDRERFCAEHWKLFSTTKDERFQNVKKGKMISDSLSFLPLFAEETGCIFEYFPKDTRFVSGFDIMDSSHNFKELCEFRYKELSVTQNVLPPDDVFCYEVLESLINKHKVESVDESTANDLGAFNTNVTKQDKASETLSALLKWSNLSSKTLICINSEARERQVRILFGMKRKAIKVVSDWQKFLASDEGFYLTYARVSSGFYDEDKGIVVVSEKEFFGTQSFSEIEYSEDKEFLEDEMLETPRGFPLTHIAKGVGRFAGLVRPDVEGAEEREYVKLEYANDSSLFVPIENLDMLTEYKGLDPETVPLDDGKGKKWINKIKSLEEDVGDVAENLLKMKISHHVQSREPYELNTYEFNKFSSGFSYMLTQDQHAAINDIKEDLTSEKVMDRLLVGDVGFGKTEVAMRACFIVANNEKQCCIIAPTTLLAAQHYETFKSRFEGTGKTIALLTRKNKKEEKDILSQLKSGEIDIIIGTHRLIQSDVNFDSLGLLVIDEEHRFGVKQKQKITELRTNLDVLSLTATPIPRTLSSTLHGVRDVSTIRTAPSKRLAIRTEIHDFDDEIIRVAIQREMLRNGQVFFLHNDTSEIQDVAERISSLIPKAKVEYAHGKMNEMMLFELMEKFRNHEFDVLVSTTIIETGIDIPNANTILINNAQNLGLAQLHQIRGRVGRGRRQAYAYLLKPKDEEISDISRKRLKAMTENTNLGGGFQLSTIDMEIRGAGEILGEKQSGHIHSLGFDLYFNMLEAAIQRLESDPMFKIELLTEFAKEKVDKIINTESNSSKTAELDTNLLMNCSLPSWYIEDEAVRIYVYRKIIRAKNEQDILNIKLEIEDRYGPMPADAEEVFLFYKAKKNLPKLGVLKVNRKQYMLSVKSKNAISEESMSKIQKSIGDMGIVMPFEDNEIQISQSRNALRDISLIDIEAGFI